MSELQKIRPMIRGLAMATVVGLTVTRALSAQDSSTTDPHAALPERPTVATHAYTVAPRYVELEAGGQLSEPAGESLFQVPVLFKIGVTPRLQFDVAPGYTRMRDHSVVTAGATDLALGLKWHMLLAAPVVGDVAFQTTLTLPSAPTRTVGTGTTDLSLLGISSHQWGAVELDLNAGITTRTGDGSRIPRMATLWTASLGAPIVGSLAVATELFGYPGTSGVAGALPAVGFLIGPTYALRRWLVLDAGGVFNVVHQEANSVYAGLTWNIGRL